MSEKELLPQLFKTEYSKIIAVLCSLLGPHHLQTAEDITHDTFLAAAQSWGSATIPDNPVAWLYTVARNKTTDHCRRHQLFRQKIRPELTRITQESEEPEVDLSDENIQDSQLRMIFVICHPAIPIESQAALALKILCGLSIKEIAAAFLTSTSNINKRLFRAKEKLRTENIDVQLPETKQLHGRIDNVLLVLYLLFNEGYYSATGEIVVRKELCREAMRLNYLLATDARTGTGAVYALLSIMCFHASRFEARIGAAGEHILYNEQDRNLWNDELIEKGNFFLTESRKDDPVTKYHLEASIAYWHAAKIDHPDKWEKILQLYNQLLMIDYSPMAALNRTYALSKANGKSAAIAAALQLDLNDHHLYHAMLGAFYTDEDKVKALYHYQQALLLAVSPADQQIISAHLRKLSN